MYTLAILIFDGVEMLDFAAPFEVFSLGGTRMAPGTIDVQTVSTRPVVTAYNGLEMRPSVVDGLPAAPDVVVLPGGLGVEPTIANDPDAVAWINDAARRASWVMSICSGALFLAHAGLLKDRRANTHPTDVDALKRMEPSVTIDRSARFVQDGKFVTSAGISAGIDSSLFLLSELLGRDVATRTAHWMEYYSDGWIRN
jgi:transcriptional regulator GlxA family with amidase domain